MNRQDIQRVLDALHRNNEHHLTYDDYGGYPESQLCQTNTAAIAALQVALAEPSDLTLHNEIDRLMKHKPLTDEEIWKAIRPVFVNDAFAKDAMTNNMEDYRAIEQAVWEKMK